ncbi:uncharacterized protein B0H18DRAFT_1116101 [Fomitopsis serialis]|uniref:uncharacterized protein n=1 Tax=Fomitopsis serialis TaxID=139415 RepID=UPI00200779EE|nr:uncharacterized protein B0H18DRAFT_1116101 [Neoantrodia serialis]KAH9931847.1 hypothetical protein B0H18DRAFT_1116101 [Neoantrodia serialis]
MTSEDPGHLQTEVCSKLQAFKLILEEVLSYLSKALCPTHGACLPREEPHALLSLQWAFYALTDSIRRTINWAFQQWGATPESNVPVPLSGIPIQAKETAGRQSAVARDDQVTRPWSRAKTAFVELSNKLIDYCGPSQVGSIEPGPSDSLSDGLGNEDTCSGGSTVDEDAGERNATGDKVAGVNRDSTDCDQGDQHTSVPQDDARRSGSLNSAEHLRSLVFLGHRVLVFVRQETQLLLVEGHAYLVRLKRSIGTARVSAHAWFKGHLVIPRRVYFPSQLLSSHLLGHSLMSVFLAMTVLAIVSRTFRHILAVWMEEEDFFNDDDYF